MARKVIVIILLLVVGVLFLAQTKISDNKSNWVTFKSPHYIASYGEEEVQFSIKHPSDWKQGFDDKGFGPEMSKYGHGFTFSKDNYEIRIALGYAPGGNLCFLSDGRSYLPENKDYVEIGSNFNTLRRVKAFVNTGPDYVKAGFTKFTLCGKNVSGNFGSNTKLGKIEYTVPDDYDLQIINEMDSIISTLNKVN